MRTMLSLASTTAACLAMPQQAGAAVITQYANVYTYQQLCAPAVDLPHGLHRGLVVAVHQPGAVGRHRALPDGLLRRPVRPLRRHGRVPDRQRADSRIQLSFSGPVGSKVASPSDCLLPNAAATVPEPSSLAPALLALAAAVRRREPTMQAECLRPLPAPSPP